MKLRTLKYALACAIAVLFTSSVQAEDFPSKEIKIIVNYGAGGSVDRTARSMQRFLPDALGQSVVVENVGGAGGKIGLKKYMKAPRDGYTILTSFAPATTYVAATAPDVFKADDIDIINVQWIDPGVIVAHKNTGWKTLDDMIKAVRANPGKHTFASSGKTSVGHVLTIDLFKKLGLDVKIVPYKGGGKTRAAFISGETDITAAGLRGMLKAKDASVPLGLYWNSSVDAWPQAIPINDLLKSEGITAEIGGAYRFHAVHSDVRKNFPDRYKKLVEAFKITTTENKDFIAFADKTKVGRDWIGPDASEALIEKVDASFTKMFK